MEIEGRNILRSSFPIAATSHAVPLAIALNPSGNSVTDLRDLTRPFVFHAGLVNSFEDVSNVICFFTVCHAQHLLRSSHRNA